MRRLLALLIVLAYPSLAGAQTYTISPPPFLLAQNNSGAIINGACVWTYVAGTTTAATTYSDNAGTPNLNPIRSDSAGRFTAFLVPGSSYKFVYEASCVPPAHATVLRTADNIAAMPAAAGNTDVLGTAGENLTLGQVVYMSNGDGGKTPGLFYRADAGNLYSSTSYWVGIATVSITSGSTGLIRLAGNMAGLTGLSVSSVYYVGSAGALTSNLSANARMVGQADTSTSLNMTANPPPFTLTPNGLPTQNATNGQVLIGRSSDNKMVLGSLTAGNGISIVGTSGGVTISSGVFAHTKTATTNPTGTASAIGVQMGLAGSITPMATGTVLFCGSGNLGGATGIQIQMTFGTGAAPANGAAATGTLIGTAWRDAVIANNQDPWGGCQLVTGLTVNTPVWYDVRLTAITAGTATTTSTAMSAVELP